MGQTISGQERRKQKIVAGRSLLRPESFPGEQATLNAGGLDHEQLRNLTIGGRAWAHLS
jgi:hypothetical protein